MAASAAAEGFPVDCDAVASEGGTVGGGEAEPEGDVVSVARAAAMVAAEGLEEVGEVLAVPAGVLPVPAALGGLLAFGTVPEPEPTHRRTVKSCSS